MNNIKYLTIPSSIIALIAGFTTISNNYPFWVPISLGVIFILSLIASIIANNDSGPFQYEVLSEESIITFDELGENVKFKRRSDVKSKVNGLINFGDKFYTSGKLENASFTPGFIDSISQDGEFFTFNYKLNRPQNKNDVFKSELNVDFIDSFTNHNEFWEIHTLDKKLSSKLYLKFPLNRKVKSILLFEGIGEDRKVSKMKLIESVQDTYQTFSISLPNDFKCYRIVWDW